jgi:hypothetical protein
VCIFVIVIYLILSIKLFYFYGFKMKIWYNYKRFSKWVITNTITMTTTNTNNPINRYTKNKISKPLSNFKTVKLNNYSVKKIILKHFKHSLQSTTKQINIIVELGRRRLCNSSFKCMYRWEMEHKQRKCYMQSDKWIKLTKLANRLLRALLNL